jgi:hypothetical protein
MSEKQQSEFNYYCPNCDEVVDQDDAQCNLCGYPIAEKGSPKQVKKPIKIPDLPYEALSTKGKIWYILTGRYKNPFTFTQQILISILALFTIIGIKIYLNFDKIDWYDVYWVEKLDGTTEFLSIPDGCGPIIEKLVQNEEVTDSEITKLRDTVPIDDASLLYSALRREWYTENGYTETWVLNMLIVMDVLNFESKVYYPQE